MKDRSERDRRNALRRRTHIRASERKRHEWAQRIQKQYGLTPEDVARMWERQHQCCALCERPLVSKVWVIDHAHKTKVFRGILCSWCNHRVLSMIERAGWLRTTNALEYLWGEHRMPPLVKVGQHDHQFALGLP